MNKTSRSDETPKVREGQRYRRLPSDTQQVAFGRTAQSTANAEQGISRERQRSSPNADAGAGLDAKVLRRFQQSAVESQWRHGAAIAGNCKMEHVASTQAAGGIAQQVGSRHEILSGRHEKVQRFAEHLIERGADTLTALAIKNAGPGMYADGEGLYLRVARTGSKSWVLRHMLDVRARAKGLGPLSLMSLADAREKAQELRKQAGMGALALRFAIMTAARTSEVTGAQWSEIDLQAAVWTVPEGRIKAQREHRAPLSQEAMRVLKAARKDQSDDSVAAVFEGRRRNPMCTAGLSAALKRMKWTDVTVHGFRSTFRDWCAEQTVFPREIAEAALAHVLTNKAEAAYQRGDLLERRRTLMDAWARFATTAPRAKQASNGTPISRARGQRKK
jgi:integrase